MKSEESAPGRLWDSSAVWREASWESVEVVGSSVEEVEDRCAN